MENNKYEERLPCGGTLRVWTDGWEIQYIFPGPDRRYNPTLLTMPGTELPYHIEALSKNLRRYEALKLKQSEIGSHAAFEIGLFAYFSVIEH
jgi:hypothetical protein